MPAPPCAAGASVAAGSGMGSAVGSAVGSATGASGASPVRSHQSVASLISMASVPSSRRVAANSPSRTGTISAKSFMLQGSPSIVMPCKVKSQVSP